MRDALLLVSAEGLLCVEHRQDDFLVLLFDNPLPSGQRHFGHFGPLRTNLCGNLPGGQLQRLKSFNPRLQNMNRIFTLLHLFLRRSQPITHDLCLVEPAHLYRRVFAYPDLSRRDPVLLRLGIQSRTVVLRQTLTRQPQGQRIGLLRYVGRVIVDICGPDGPVFLDKMPCGVAELVFPNDTVCAEKTRHKHDRNQHSISDCALVRTVFFLYRSGKMEILDYKIGRQRDENAVDEKEVQRAARVVPVKIGDTVSDRTKRRHQSGRNRYTGQHRAFLLTGHLQNTCYASEKCDNHVIDGWIGSRQ